MESKFLDQDVDVVSLAIKGIVIGCFVGRNYTKTEVFPGLSISNIFQYLYSKCSISLGVLYKCLDGGKSRNRILEHLLKVS